MWTLYILKCGDDSLYTGITTDLERRVTEHNSSVKGAKYTRARRPVKCVYFCEYESRSDACKAEWVMKKLSREQKQKIINEKRP